MTIEHIGNYVTLALHPEESQREFAVVVHNRSRSHLDLTLHVPDSDKGLQFQFDWEKVLLESGGTVEAGLIVHTVSQMKRGSRHSFGVTALSEGEVVASAAGTFVVPGRTFGDRLAIIVVSALAVAGIIGIGAAMLCPTVLRQMCPLPIPENPLSGILSNPTEAPTSFVFQTPTKAWTSTAVQPVVTPLPSTNKTATSPAPIMTPTNTIVPTPVYGISLLTYVVSTEQGVSLVASIGLGDPITLVSEVDEVMVLDYTPADGGKLAVRVVNEGAETLQIISTDGTPIRNGISQGWLRIKDARWSPDGSWLVTEADVPGLTTYYIYDGLDGALLSQPPLFPRTPTSTFSSTPTSTQTPTFTPTPHADETEMIIVALSLTPYKGDIVTEMARVSETAVPPG